MAYVSIIFWYNTEYKKLNLCTHIVCFPATHVTEVPLTVLFRRTRETARRRRGRRQVFTVARYCLNNSCSQIIDNKLTRHCRGDFISSIIINQRSLHMQRRFYLHEPNSLLPNLVVITAASERKYNFILSYL